MAAYQTTIIETAAKRLHTQGRALQSVELRYQKAAFLEWLQQNIELEEIIQALFKQTCLANGVRLAVYNQYFSDNNPEVLRYILQEATLRSIMMVFATGQRPQDSSVCKTLEKTFNFTLEQANEIINIVGSVVNTQYEPRSIAVKEHKHFIEKAKSNFWETRNALCYTIAQKEIDSLQLNLTGSILDDLTYGLKIIISTIELIHYDLLLSPWNRDITFTTKGGMSHKNALPSTLYNYYLMLQQLLDLANRSPDPAQYQAIFISKTEPFLEILQKEGNSFLAKSLSHHYKWHCLQLSVLLDLPKWIHKVKAAAPQNSKEIHPSAESFTPPPSPSAENIAQMPIDIEVQPISLPTSERDAIQSESIGNYSSVASEKAAGKEKQSPPHATIDQYSARSLSLSEYEHQRRSSILNAPPTTSLMTYEPSIFADEKNANDKQMHAILLEVIIQRIHSNPEPGEQSGIGSPLFHRHSLSQSQASSSEGHRVDTENALFRNWLLSTHTRDGSSTIYDDFNDALRERIAQSLPKYIDMSDFKYINFQIIHYFLADSMHNTIAVYAATNNLLTRKYSILDEANRCIDSFCSLHNLDRDIFKNYEMLSHLLAKELQKRSSSGSTSDSFFITEPHRKESVQLTEDEIKRFYACKEVVRQIGAKRAVKANLDSNIREFCEKNAIKIEDIMGYTEQSLQEEGFSSESGLLHDCIQLAKNALMLEKEIQDYDEAIKAVKILRYIDRYELMIQNLMQIGTLWMNYRDATRVITLYGHGLMNPYLFKITFEKYQELVEKEENSFSNMKHEVYYRVAEKRMGAFKGASSILSLIDILSRLKYTVTVIELAPYDSQFFSDQKITYTLNGQLHEKHIPSLLYRYREELNQLIEKATTAQDHSYLQELKEKIESFQSEPADDSTHWAWHRKFLAQLYVIVNSLLEKGKQAVAESELHSAMHHQPIQKHRRNSNSSVSFHSEHQRRNSGRSSSAGIQRNDLPPKYEHPARTVAPH